MSKIKCNHCHLEFPVSVMIEEKADNNNLFFCCKGCQGVYHILKDDNLDSFYDKLGNKTIKPPLSFDDDTSKFDEEAFGDIYVKTTPEGFQKVDLIIEGIHCAACVWLNEKVLHELDGIIEANINFTNNKAKITWDGDLLKLSQIIKKIRTIGYNAYAYDSNVADEKATKAKQDYFIKMMVAVFASVNIMMLGVAKYTGFFKGIDVEIKHMIHVAEFILTTPVLFYSGFVFFKGAYFGLKNRILNMDFLVATGASLSYIYSVYILLGGAGESYFDSVTMIITFVLVGKYLEVIGKKGAVDTLDTIKSKLPLQATVIKDGIKKVMPLAKIKVSDIIELKVGEKACVDGELYQGESTFDESSLTGESLPIFKKNSDKISSGSINLDSTILYKALKTYEDSTLNSIVTLLEDSLSSKPQIEHKANEVSKSFSVAILGLSVLTFLTWYFLGLDLGFDYDNTSVFEKSFIVAISVIVIACPCALALATPIASLIGISQLAKKGLLFKEAKFLESLARCTTIVLDKTGTLTKGELSIVKATILSEDKKNLNLLYSLVDSSNHPISTSIKNYLKEKYKEIKNEDIFEVKTHQARGLSAKYKTSEGENYSLLGGNLELLKENGITYKIKIDNSVYIFCINNKVIATFLLKDTVKEDACEFIEYVKSENLQIVMLTGDNEKVASVVAKELGIDTYISQVNPIEKAAYIKELKKEGKTVIMAGDGVNDSVALSSCDVGIAMGNGSDIAIMVSDIVLLDNSLKALKEAFIISKRTYKFIKQNLFISLVYNIITIPLAMFGLVIPLVAALSMSLSSLLVVANSLRIKKG